MKFSLSNAFKYPSSELIQEDEADTEYDASRVRDVVNTIKVAGVVVLDELLDTYKQRRPNEPSEKRYGAAFETYYVSAIGQQSVRAFCMILYTYSWGVWSVCGYPLQ